MPKAVISASVNLDVANYIVAEARERGWPISKIVNRILADYFERKSSQQPRPRGKQSGGVVTVRAEDQLYRHREEEK